MVINKEEYVSFSSVEYLLNLAKVYRNSLVVTKIELVGYKKDRPVYDIEYVEKGEDVRRKL